MLSIAVDGACRRNGKPDCVSAGGIFVQSLENGVITGATSIFGVSETHSTNQRGEMRGLLNALELIMNLEEDCRIITDSEYMFNTITKQWFVKWRYNKWLTAAGTPVKNKDLWMRIASVIDEIAYRNVDVDFYHIKGHVFPFGAKTAENIMQRDPSGSDLYNAMLEKYDSVCNTTRADEVAHASDLFERNNGCKLPDHLLREFIVANSVADVIATKFVNAADLQFIIDGTLQP